MAPTQLPSPSWRKPQAPATSSSAACSDEKARFKQTQSAHLGSQQQRQHLEWAPSQVVRLQRIERQERESLSQIRADGLVHSNNSSDLDTQQDDDNNSERATQHQSQAEAHEGEAREEIQDFDVDEIFHLSPATCPNMRAPLEPVLQTPESCSSRYDEDDDIDDENQQNPSTDDAVSALKLKIFTGSWNMAAKDPFVDKKGQYIGDAMASLSLAEFLPPGYDVYVIGTQEKVSKHLHSAVLARLNSTANQGSQSASAARYTKLGLHAPSANSKAPKRSFSPSSPSAAAPRSSPSFVVNSRHDNNDSDLNGSFMDEVLRASSFGLEGSSDRASSSDAGLSSSFISASSTTATAEKSSEARKLRKHHRSAHEVRGRGDGAFLHSKSTSIAIYVAVRLEPVIEVVRVGAHKFSLTSGSKGGLAVMLRFAGDQTLTFVNCHLEANRPTLRRQQLETLMKKLPVAMGFEDKEALDLATCSDHVVWMGDFNYRIHSLDGETVLKLLGSGRHMELHDRYDSMKDDVDFVSGMRSFKEATKWPTFYPTYKKLPHRPSCVVVENNPAWPLQVYRVRYKEPFYKGGRVKARVPGWCDRILHCSKSAWQSYLAVERVACELPGQSLRENYRSVNDALRGSDHSPVFCTFEWTIGVRGSANR